MIERREAFRSPFHQIMIKPCRQYGAMHPGRYRASAERWMASWLERITFLPLIWPLHLRGLRQFPSSSWNISPTHGFPV